MEPYATIYKKLTDADLVDRLRSNDQGAYTELYRRYHGKIVAYGHRFIAGQNESIKEIAQDVFLKAWQHKHTIDPSKGSFNSWIYRVAHNEYVNFLKLRNQKDLPFEDYREQNPEFDVMMPHGKDFDSKQADYWNYILAQLDPRDANIIVLFHVYGYSYRELAVGQKVRLSTVGVRLQRARAKLRKIISTTA